MSASELSRRVTKVLQEKRERVAEVAQAICYEFPQLGADGAVVAPPTVENIAMRVIEANAALRTYDQAIAIVAEIFRELTSPDKGTSARQPREQTESPYA